SWRLPHWYAGDEEVHTSARVDSVVGVSLIETTEHRPVNRRLDPIPPRGTEQHHEQALVEVIHLVVVETQRRGVDGVWGGQDRADLGRDPVCHGGHVTDHVGQARWYGGERTAPKAHLRHVLGQVTHALQ